MNIGHTLFINIGLKKYCNSGGMFDKVGLWIKHIKKAKENK